MFRRTSTILEPGDSIDAQTAAALAAADADVIMTSVVLGFSADQVAQGNPMAFHAPRDSWDEEQLVKAVALINEALGATCPDGAEVAAAPTPEWEIGAMITGTRAGTSVAFDKHHRELADPTVRMAHAIASTDKNVGRQGWGAYTGFVDDPKMHRAGLMPTTRFTVTDDWPGSRWSPPRDDDGLVGYAHGMVQAIYECLATGAWCTPYEIAVGDYTTRLAACLPCGLFMHAAGFRPTAIHLGRAESWMPVSPDNRSDDGYSEPVDEAIRSTNETWYQQCRKHLALGAEILDGSGMLAETHVKRLALLRGILHTESEEPTLAANLILDALTVADHEVERIIRTLTAD